MPDQDRNQDRNETPPQAKRTGRDSAEPRNQPGEFADDMATNRFEPPPDPGEGKGK
jgi:hypothetical protein